MNEVENLHILRQPICLQKICTVEIGSKIFGKKKIMVSFLKCFFLNLEHLSHKWFFSFFLKVFLDIAKWTNIYVQNQISESTLEKNEKFVEKKS